MLSKLSFCLLFFIYFALAQQTFDDDKVNSQDINVSDPNLLAIYSALLNKDITILDIAPITIPDELINLKNENVNKILGSIKSFNKFIENYKIRINTVEQSVKSSKDYDTCETTMYYTECKYFRDKGEYSITFIQEMTPMYFTYKAFYSGIFDGLDYGKNYMIQYQYFLRNGKGYTWEFYRPPTPPESANQISRTYEFRIYDDSTTIFTPWGIYDKVSLVYKDTDYRWEVNSRKNHPNVRNKFVVEGNKLTMLLEFWDPNKEGLYPAWVGYWDFDEMKGNWISFDKDGRYKNSGKM